MMEELMVRKIENGSVIDHITAGKGLKVVNILNLTPDESSILLMNVPSKKLGRKDIVKVENRRLTASEVNKISIIAPHATLNIIENGEVKEKRKVVLPNLLENIIKCPNMNCITNSNEPMRTKFIVEKREPVKIRCFYCEKLFSSEEIMI
jgi:aspartate carbamoyltransferase regulatory subunit